MLSNRLAFAALSVACIGAAAAGGYFASRPAEPAAPAAVQTTSSAPAQTPPVASPAAAPGRPVQETEAGVSGPARKAPAEPASPVVTATKRVDKTPAKGMVAARQEPLSALTNTWPGNAQPSPATPASASAAVEAPAPRSVENVERAAPEPPRAPESPQKVFEELAISADSVIGLQTETRITSETARVEDRVEARVTRDVKVGDHVAIPAGSRAIGSVIRVERGGKFKERARLGIRFHTLVLADGTRLPISTETVFRDGETPTAAAKVGGAAVGGAILGAILGGGKGAAIGGAAGAGVGAAAAANSDRNAAVFPPGAQLTVRLVSPVTVTIER